MLQYFLVFKHVHRVLEIEIPFKKYRVYLNSIILNFLEKNFEVVFGLGENVFRKSLFISFKNIGAWQILSYMKKQKYLPQFNSTISNLPCLDRPTTITDWLNICAHEFGLAKGFRSALNLQQEKMRWACYWQWNGGGKGPAKEEREGMQWFDDTFYIVMVYNFHSIHGCLRNWLF